MNIIPIKAQDGSWIMPFYAVRCEAVITTPETTPGTSNDAVATIYAYTDPTDPTSTGAKVVLAELDQDALEAVEADLLARAQAILDGLVDALAIGSGATANIDSIITANPPV